MNWALNLHICLIKINFLTKLFTFLLYLFMALESCVYGKIEAQDTHMLLFLGEISEIRFEARNIISITSSLTFSFVFFFSIPLRLNVF